MERVGGRVERIGILGGAFDPPHIGHLILGETARAQLALDRVLYLPTGQPPHKEDQNVSAAQHRLMMTQLAVAGNPFFAASAIDIDRPGPHYTVTLRPYLEAAFGAAAFILIIGGDSLRDLPEWREPGTIVAQWELAALPRPGSDFNLDALEKVTPGVTQATTFLDGPSVSLSSTQIRRWIQEGRSLRYTIPAPVFRYIKENALYRG